jgi:hypothetical protein
MAGLLEAEPDGGFLERDLRGVWGGAEESTQSSLSPTPGGEWESQHSCFPAAASGSGMGQGGASDFPDILLLVKGSQWPWEASSREYMCHLSAVLGGWVGHQ